LRLPVVCAGCGGGGGQAAWAGEWGSALVIRGCMVYCYRELSILDPEIRRFGRVRS